MTKRAFAGALVAVMLSGCGLFGSDPAADTATTGASSQGLTLGTYHYVATENCMDIWMQACTSSFPQPQCPDNPGGQQCIVEFGSCYISHPNGGGGSYDEYACY